MLRVRTAVQARIHQRSVPKTEAHAQRARSTRTRLGEVVISRIVSALRASRHPHPAHVNNAWLVSTKQRREMVRAGTVEQANTRRQLQLQERANAQRVRRIQTRLRGVTRLRIGPAMAATQAEATVVCAQAVRQASTRRFLDLALAATVQAGSTHL